MIDLSKLKTENEVIATFTTTSSYCEYHCIIAKDSDDICRALEYTLHQILGANGTPEDVQAIMGASVPTEEEMEELEVFNEYNSIDLGYVIPGLITSFTKQKEIYHERDNK